MTRVEHKEKMTIYNLEKEVLRKKLEILSAIRNKVGFSNGSHNG